MIDVLPLIPIPVFHRTTCLIVGARSSVVNIDGPAQSGLGPSFFWTDVVQIGRIAEAVLLH